jgi:hypothetical protein
VVAAAAVAAAAVAVTTPTQMVMEIMINECKNNKY